MMMVHVMIFGLALGVATRHLRTPRSRSLAAPVAGVDRSDLRVITWVFPLESLGATLRQAVRRAVPSAPAGDPVSNRALGARVLAMAILVPLEPIAALMVPAAAQIRSVLRRRRLARKAARALADGLADVIDVFAIALTAGDSIAQATTRVGVWVGGEYGTAFAACARQASLGRPLADAFEDLPDQLGDGVRPLVAALIGSERFGAPIAGGLARLAAEARAERRRAGERDARRLPVALLFPLVVCVLPAFVLLTVVPVLVRSLSFLELSGAS